MRDANRQRLYRAEQSVRRSANTGGRGGSVQGDLQLPSVADCEDFLLTLRREFEPDVDYAKNPINLSFLTTRGTSWYRKYGKGRVPEIALQTRWGKCGTVLTHEYTHHLQRCWNSEVPSHGGEFCRAMLDTFDFYARITNRPFIIDGLREAYAREKVLWEPVAQCAAARKQILRLRSDVQRIYGNDHAIPTTCLVIAAHRDDFTGETYSAHYNVALSTAWSYKETLVDARRYGDPLNVPMDRLRYVEAPMVRWR